MDARETKNELLQTLDAIIPNAPITGYWDKAGYVTIKYNGSGVLKLINDKGTLVSLRKGFNRIGVNNSIPKFYTKPSTKPTGKDLNQLVKQYKEEAQRQMEDREELKNSYYYYLNESIPDAKLKLKEWEERFDTWVNRKITLKSLTPLFRKTPSRNDLYDKMATERKNLEYCEKRLEEIKETILSIPSLKNEMGF